MEFMDSVEGRKTKSTKLKSTKRELSAQAGRTAASMIGGCYVAAQLLPCVLSNCNSTR
jgi:hypothetical protein